MLKKIAIGFGLLVLITVSVGCWNYAFFPAAKARAAVKNLNEQHAAADIEGDQIFRSRISSFQQLGIIGEKVAESKADSCYINPLGDGFGFDTWEQHCKLNYLAGYTALLSREETFTRIETASLHKEDRTFPKRLHPHSRRGCRFSSLPGNNVRYVPAGSIPEGDDCRIPDPVYGITPRGVGRPGSTKFDYTFDPDAIDQNVDLLWITYSHRYYREDLGCRGLLCGDSPRSTPVQAD